VLRLGGSRRSGGRAEPVDQGRLAQETFEVARRGAPTSPRAEVGGPATAEKARDDVVRRERRGQVAGMEFLEQEIGTGAHTIGARRPDAEIQTAIVDAKAGWRRSGKVQNVE